MIKKTNPVYLNWTKLCSQISPGCTNSFVNLNKLKVASYVLCIDRRSSTFFILENKWVNVLFHMWNHCYFLITFPDLIFPSVLRDISERGRDLESILAQYITFVKPAFEEFCLPVSYLLCLKLPSLVCIVCVPDLSLMVKLFLFHWCYLDKEICWCDHTERSW